MADDDDTNTVCHDYRPDHNGECLNCDEPAEAHALALLTALLAARAEIEDFRRSFDLYHTASMALMHAYKAAHPEVAENVWPDATVVNVWAADQVESYQLLLAIMGVTDYKSAVLAWKRQRDLVTTAETLIRENNVIIDELRALVDEDVCKTALRMKTRHDQEFPPDK